MRKLNIYRERKLASALVPLWVIFGISKSDFMKKYQISNDTSCELRWNSHPKKRFDFYPDDIGVRINVGQIMDVEIIDEKISSIFALTFEGLLSNELEIRDIPDQCQIVLSVKGGWKTPSYPVLYYRD